jgi:hypothetical protein
MEMARMARTPTWSPTSISSCSDWTNSRGCRHYAQWPKFKFDNPKIQWIQCNLTTASASTPVSLL